MKDTLHKNMEDLKKHINILLMEDYLSGLENYFMPDGSLKKLYITSGSGDKTAVFYLSLAGYFPIFIEEINYKNINKGVFIWQ